MGKKVDDADVKKECPSCGLGVALEAKICEFCGWDFDEEDEWIIQIEKLERDLVQEKQKFEPGTVGSKIEASLHTPAVVKREQIRASAAKAKLQQQMEEVLGSHEVKKEPEKTVAPSEPVRVEREAELEEVRPVQAHEEPPTIAEAQMEAEPATAATPSPSPSGKVRRIRKIKSPQTEAPSGAQAQPPKGKIIRKSKG